ncbi:MAG: O-antigen ligase family protein [Syntrophales bacterium]|nr:O-antigen ligase family protein [Syntrophales bacterium]
MQDIPVQTVAGAEETSRYRVWFFIAMLYLIVDYARPQDILTFLGPLRPGMITILLLAACVVFSGKIVLSWSSQTRLIWAFILLLFIHIPFAKNTYFALNAGLEMLKFMPFILSVIILVDSIGRLKRLVIVSVIIMAYISFYGIKHAGMGSGGWFNDENDISLYINTMLPFVAHLYYHERARIKKFLYAGIFALGIATIITSFSRGGLVGIMAMVAVAWLISRHKIRMFVIICLAAFAFFAYTSQEYKAEISTITNTQSGTIHGRIITWGVAWDMFLDYPLGVGGNNFPVRFEEYQTKEFSRGMWGRVAHSLWFTLIPELGIPGIIIYFMLLLTNFKTLMSLLRLKYEDNPDLLYIRTLSLAFLVSAAGFFASATGLSVLYYPHFWYLTAMLVATENIAIKMNLQPEQ